MPSFLVLTALTYHHELTVWAEDVEKAVAKVYETFMPSEAVKGIEVLEVREDGK